MKKHNFTKGVLCCFLVLLIICSCTFFTVSAKKSQMQDTEPDYALILSNAFSSYDLPQEETASSPVVIDLNIVFSKDFSSIPGVRISEGSILITEPGLYLLSGSMAGTVVIDADSDADVNLILDNAAIQNDTGAAIYVRSAKRAAVTLKDGSDNILENSGEFQADGTTKVDGVIFSKSDLYILGSGSLSIASASGCGIVSKDSLIITGGSISIDSQKAGLEAKDEMLLSDSSFHIDSLANGIKTDSDTSDLGNLYIKNSEFAITSASNAIKTSGYAVISGGSFYLKTGGGCPVLTPVTSDHDPDLDDTAAVSAKGFSADGIIAILDGYFDLDCADDGIHSETGVLIENGTLSIRSADDAIHGRETLTIKNGQLDIYAQEGLEGTFILIESGDLAITASGDGMNAANKSDAYEATAMINGGTIGISLIEGDNDGIDSNGNLYISGGTIEISGALNAFDYLDKAEYNGGTIIVNGETVNQIVNQVY